MNFSFSVSSFTSFTSSACAFLMSLVPSKTLVRWTGDQISYMFFFFIFYFELLWKVHSWHSYSLVLWCWIFVASPSQLPNSFCRVFWLDFVLSYPFSIMHQHVSCGDFLTFTNWCCFLYHSSMSCYSSGLLA